MAIYRIWKTVSAVLVHSLLLNTAVSVKASDGNLPPEFLSRFKVSEEIQIPGENVEPASASEADHSGPNFNFGFHNIADTGDIPDTDDPQGETFVTQETGKIPDALAIEPTVDVPEKEADEAATTKPESGDCKQAATALKSDEKAKPKACDKKKKEALAKAVASAHKGVFYDNDFAYVLDPCYRGSEIGDLLKRQPLTGNITTDLGGQYRFRFHSEQNLRGQGLTGRDDDFLLHRTRLFANVQAGKHFRVFAEYLDAVSTNEQFAPRAIEENRSDMLNLFADAVLLDDGQDKVTVRAGRQELLFGDERLISPLDWANTRRTFDGSRVLYRSKKLDMDGFWVMPLRTDPSQFDGPIRDQQLYGVHSTYRGDDSDVFESFYLAFDDDRTGQRVDNFGGRLFSGYDDWLAELWGNYQFGTNPDDAARSAGAWTCGLGRNLPGSWKPTLWVFYDWASGGRSLGRGEGNFQFFPLAHKYLGFMDLFGRSNIESPNARLTFDPSEKLQILVWYYYLFLETKQDTPYSVAMVPFSPGVTPGAAELGHEIDLLSTYKLGPRSSLVGGYSHFFSGAYYDTPGLPFSGDADFLYLQYQLNF
jgi:Alginate export